MTVKGLNTDPEKVAIILLIQKIKFFNPQMGAYIEHFSCTNQDIIIKLTNGFLKIKQYLVNEGVPQNNEFSVLELEKVAKKFVKIAF